MHSRIEAKMCLLGIGYYHIYTHLLYTLLSSADIFSKSTFFKKIFQERIHSVNLDPDQARNLVGPGLGPNCLPRLSADDT